MKTKIYILTMVLFFGLTMNAQVHVITQSNLTFSPSSIEVAVGDTIRWEWTQGIHTTTSSAIPLDALAWESDLTEAVPFFEYKINVAGTYHYYCFFHEFMGMSGVIIASNPLGVENYHQQAIEIFPNPAVDFLNFRYFESTKEYNVEILDISGRIIQNVTIDKNSAINIEHLKSGVYFLVINDSSGLVSKQKFIKN